MDIDFILEVQRRLNDIENFLHNKVIQYCEVYFYDEPERFDFDSYEFRDNRVIVWYCDHYYGDTGLEAYELPLDILFDDDFQDKMKEIKQKKDEEDAKKLAERQKQNYVTLRDEKLKMLKELLRTFPEEARQMMK